MTALSAGALLGCGGMYSLGASESSEGGEGGALDAGSGGKGGAGSVGKGGSTAGQPVEGSSGTNPGVGGEGSGSVGGEGSGGAEAGLLRIRERPTDKLDLLFMIDNSIGMSVKQRHLAESVPHLLTRLVTPRCIDDAGTPTGELTQADGTCATGWPEFPPLKDIHVGVITSSLGDHGSGQICADSSSGRTPDDKAQLLGSVRDDIPGNSSGFLSWRSGDDLGQLSLDFAEQIQSAGESGCGYEGSLEAWYRFLVDPEPVGSMSNEGVVSVRGETNDTVLAQRADFLRPDSLLAIVMLTDENDCSVLDENNTQGWLVGWDGDDHAGWRMPQATASCANPNDACCRPCIAPAAVGCPDNAQEGCFEEGRLSTSDDSMNLRCFQQVQRFGVDLLYPTERYASALRDDFIDPRLDGNFVRNPLFAPQGDLPGRTRDMVYLSAIVGVPWQDIATEESLTDPSKLEYLSARELAEKNRFAMIAGDRASNTPPSDPLMIESIEPRPIGAPHPLVPNAAIVDPTWTSLSNAINGHEQAVDPERRDDLQFACIFPLAQAVSCRESSSVGCECTSENFVKNSPLCSYPVRDGDQTPIAGAQTHDKAYPGLRHLEVLKSLGDQGLVASICPKLDTPAPDSDPQLDMNFGYTPAMGGLLRRLREGIGPTCIERQLPVESTPDGDRTSCRVVEARRSGSCECDPDLARLSLDGDDPARLDALSQLEAEHQCGGDSGVDCDSFCLCEIRQLENEALTACQNESELPAGDFGFCYIDGAAENTAPNLTRSCPDRARRILRFAGDGAVTPGAFALLSCPVDE